jgi:DNA ligase-1
VCYDQEQVDAAEQRFVEEGYEGAMRRADLPYEFKRSFNLLKIKRFEDSEFEILDIIEGRGKLTGHAGSLKFHTAEGREFYAKPALPDTMLREIFERPDDYLHRQATVKYQGKSNDGIPRFPVVKDIL